jgi:Signal transduction histidine kinase
MKKLISIVLLTLFASVFNLDAQTKVDSLLNVLETQTLTPREQFDISRQLRNFYRNSDMDKFIEYSKLGLSIADKEKDKTTRYKMYDIAYDELGTGYTLKGEYDSAIIYYEKALEYAHKIKDRSIHTVYLNYGAVYYQQGRYNTALEYLLKALSLCREVDNKVSEVTILSNIANIYSQLGDYDHAKNYIEQCKNIVEEHNLENRRILVYEDLRSLHLSMKEYDKALEYGLQVEAICKEQNNKRHAINNNVILATIYSKGFKDYDKAMIYAEEAMNTAEEFGDPHAIYISLSYLAQSYLYKKRYKESESLAIKAWEIDSTNTDYSIGLACIIAFSNMYLNNKEKAMFFGEKIQELINNSNKKEYHANLMNMEIKYETEKKELRIDALEKEQSLYRLLSGSAVIIALLIFGLLFYRHRLNVHKRKEAEQQIIQLEQEKQLISAKALLDGENTERSRLARDLHDGLGGMLSVIKLNLNNMQTYSVMEEQDVNLFQNALKMLDQSIGEMRRVSHNIMPYALMQHGLKTALEDFCHSIPEAHFNYIGNDQRLDNQFEILIYRCAHELINNAIKHAKATNINIQLMIDNGLISLSVQDNGIGFDAKKVGNGAGLENIRTRLSTYNGKMNIYSSSEIGTEISVEIELK